MEEDIMKTIKEKISNIKLSPLPKVSEERLKEIKKLTETHKKFGRKRTEQDWIFIDSLRNLSKEERYFANAERHLKMKDQFYRSTSQGVFCETCWLLDYSCTCKKIKPIKTRHRYVTLLHYREYKRGTNTAIILPTASADQNKTPLLISGLREDEKILEDILKENKNTFILFPTPESTTIEEYFNQNIKKDNDNITYEEWVNNELITIVIIDSTWKQARSLAGRYPESIPRIHLASPPEKSESNMRKQSEEGRITTAEAVISVFEELRESEETISIMRHNLNERVKAMNWQCGRSGKIPRKKQNDDNNTSEITDFEYENKKNDDNKIK